MWNSAQVVPNEPKALGERLKKRRLEFRLFQKEVAKLIGTHTATIQNWERGIYEPAERFLPSIERFPALQPGERELD
jgi:DNA-binding transcriptional regulator YiaG